MRTARVLTCCGLLLAAVVIGAAWVLRTIEHPETRIVGAWQEVSWSYEKADDHGSGVGSGATFDEALRREVSKGLLIHESETWRFDPGARLVLQKQDRTDDSLQWRIKGRGHMLELRFNDRHQEVYQICSLDNDRLVLQFNNNMIARGIVRIVFKRVTADA